MGLGRRKVARQLPPTSREVLPVRPLRGPWSYWGTGKTSTRKRREPSASMTLASAYLCTLYVVHNSLSTT